MFFCYVILLENSRGSYWLDVFALEGKCGDQCCERILKWYLTCVVQAKHLLHRCFVQLPILL